MAAQKVSGTSVSYMNCLISGQIASRDNGENDFGQIMEQTVKSVDKTQTCSSDVNNNHVVRTQNAASKQDAAVKTYKTGEQQQDDVKEVVQKIAEAVEQSGEDADIQQIMEETGLDMKQLQDVLSELTGMLEEVMGQIKELLLSYLDVSEEELLEQMEILGLGFMDLFVSENLTELTVSFTGESADITTLLTDESLYKDFKQVLQQMDQLQNDLSNRLGMTDTELSAFLQTDTGQLMESAIMKQFTDKLEAVMQEMNKNVESQDAGLDVIKAVQTEEMLTGQEIQQNNKAVSEETMKDSLVHMEQSVADTVQQTEEVNRTLYEDGQNRQNREDNGSQTTTQTFATFVQQLTESTQAVFNQRTETLYSSAQTESIIRQVMEQVSVMVTEDSSSIEMQLHPESLGRLNLQVAVKAGVVTAQIAAENQTVKEALESQLVQLKEQMNEHGVKIEAIEVTVASHEFESAYNQEHDKKSENPDMEQEQGRRSLRTDFPNEEEELSGEEELRIRMMREQGNRVDFIA